MITIDSVNLQSIDLDIVVWILLSVIIFFFIVQILYYTIVYYRPFTYRNKINKSNESDDSYPPISVIIASKNESENLSKHLPFILEQDYPNFEVIIVNMGSTDETDMVLKALNQKYTNLYHTYVPAEAEDINEKKLALTLGIKAANNDILLFTEAHCKPASNKWLAEFAKEFIKGNDIVLGACRLDIKKRVGMRKFIQYDNMVHSLKYLSLAIMGKPFMGIGRNLAYKKELFFDNKGFSSILRIDGGEDDLFINRVAKGKKTGVVLSDDSMTRTNVVDKFNTWRLLKSKHLYTKQFYKGPANAIFRFEAFSKYSFVFFSILGIVAGLLSENYTLISISALFLIIRYLIMLFVINKSSIVFGIKPFHIDLIFYELFQPINNIRFKKFANRRNKYRK